ncbi:MAG: hypothetical protein ABSB22_16145 [Thermodesulfobacteriota bacterium]
MANLNGHKTGNVDAAKGMPKVTRHSSPYRLDRGVGSRGCNRTGLFIKLIHPPKDTLAPLKTLHAFLIIVDRADRDH